jgi:3D-(3,5/4)-trihydroxycyclohexane-1,2-dione acylhydrolase (decyclizing)
MTVGQALVEFLGNQYTVHGNIRQRTIVGTFGIFGHGNVAGVGQALKQLSVSQPNLMPYHQARNEQAMVHESVAYSRISRRLSTFACTASVGPGASNMLTGAALATINRLPVLLLPSDTFATRVADPVLQQLEIPSDASLSVNDAFKPLSRFFDRVHRPEQLFSAALGAMRVLTDPVETGAVTISLPEDVQAETIEVPTEFLTVREWRIRRPRPDIGLTKEIVEQLRNSKRPMIIAGGGIIYANAHEGLAKFVEATKIPVGASQGGVGSLNWDHPQYLGAVGATGTLAANKTAREADLIIGIGTRYSDFTTASRTAFQNPNVRFININVASFDALKHGSSLPVVADARVTLEELLTVIGNYRIDSVYESEIAQTNAEWHETVDAAFTPSNLELPGQAEIIGAVQGASDPRDVLICAAGSLPGDLHKLWRVRDPLGYHVEYGYSCMGYEIAGGIGVRRAAPDRDAIVMVGDGSYLMMHTEIVSAVAEGLKVIILLIQNHGYASIGHLSEDVGSQRYGTKYRYRDASKNNFDGEKTLPIDLATNAESLGINVIRVEPTKNSISDLATAVKKAKSSDVSTLIHINSDPLLYSPGNDSWWDVPIAEVSTLESTQKARTIYENKKKLQKPYLGETKGK